MLGTPGLLPAADIVRVSSRHADLFLSTSLYADAIDSVITRTRAQLIDLLGDSLSYRPKVWLVSDADQFDSLLGGAFPDWGAAAAMPGRGLIVLRSPEQYSLARPLSELLAHEYAHLVVDHRCGGKAVPRWFQEGIAQMVSSEWDYWDNLVATRISVFNQFIGLYEIDLVNRFAEPKAQVAYAQSYMAVRYLYEAYGRGAVGVFLDRLRSGYDPGGIKPPIQRARPSVSPLVDQALLESVGSDYLGFQEEVFSNWRARFNIGVLLMDSWFLWLGLAVVVIIGAVLRFRRRKDYYRRWEDEDRLQSRDFDYGDSDDPEAIDDDEPWRA
jgi:LPXTG-motif cell wall-anchored protein